MVLEHDRVVRAAPIMRRLFLGLSLDEAKAIGILARIPHRQFLEHEGSPRWWRSWRSLSR
jgi:hypothetical protein